MSEAPRWATQGTFARARGRSRAVAPLNHPGVRRQPRAGALTARGHAAADRARPPSGPRLTLEPRREDERLVPAEGRAGLVALAELVPAVDHAGQRAPTSSRWSARAPFGSRSISYRSAREAAASPRSFPSPLWLATWVVFASSEASVAVG